MKAQINLEYIVAFMIFILAVIYVAGTTFSALPQFYESLNDNNLKERAWVFSERLMAELEEENFVLNKTRADEWSLYMAFNPLTGSYTAEYKTARERFNLSEENEFYVEMNYYPIALTQNYNQAWGNHTGSLVVDNKTTSFIVINTSTIFNMTVIDGTYLREGENKTLGTYGRTFTVEKIDRNGNFVILRNAPPLIQFGIENIEKVNMREIRRYSSYENHLAAIDIKFM